MNNKTKTFSDEEKNNICNSYKNAADRETQPKILSELYACDIESITDVLEERGLIEHAVFNINRTVSGRIKWDDNAKTVLLSLIDSGLTYDEIAVKLKTSKSAVANIIHSIKSEANRESDCSINNIERSTSVEAEDGPKNVIEEDSIKVVRQSMAKTTNENCCKEESADIVKSGHAQKLSELSELSELLYDNLSNYISLVREPNKDKLFEQGYHLGVIATLAVQLKEELNSYGE